MGRIETGVVFEQKVLVKDAQNQELILRRVIVHLDKPTRDGDTQNVWRVRVYAFGGCGGSWGDDEAVSVIGV